MNEERDVGYGFNWHPGDHLVEVRTSGPVATVDEDEPDYRISVRTALLRDVDTAHPEFVAGIAALNRTAPTYAFCSDEEPTGRVFLQATTYVHKSTAGWLPDFIAGTTILQPIEAQFRAERAAGVLGGKPDRSHSQQLDEMLGVEETIYIPAGKKESRWIGTGEFEEIVKTIGRSKRTFGMGDTEQLTLEISFGSSSALLQLLTDQPHPTLGNGLLVLLRFPFSLAPKEAAKRANALNSVEANSWVQVPLIGAWTASGGDLAYSGFIPNLL